MPSLPSDYLKVGMTRLHALGLYKDAYQIGNIANELMVKSSPGKPSAVMAAVFYLRAPGDLGIRRTQEEIGEAFGCSEMPIRQVIKRCKDQVMDYGRKHDPRTSEARPARGQKGARKP